MFAEGLLRYSCLWFHLIFIRLGSGTARCDPFKRHLVPSGKTPGWKMRSSWMMQCCILVSVTLSCHSLLIYFSHRLNFFHFSLCLHFRERPFGTVRGGKYSSHVFVKGVCVYAQWHIPRRWSSRRRDSLWSFITTQWFMMMEMLHCLQRVSCQRGLTYSNSSLGYSFGKHGKFVSHWPPTLILS